MGHIKLKNHTGQDLTIKMKREHAPALSDYECKDWESQPLPMWIDGRSGKVTKTTLTITAKEKEQK